MTTPIRLAADQAAAGGPPHPDSLTFREGMSRFAEAVTIVTTGGPAGPAGVTATAVTSVSDQPPLLLVCLNRSSQSAPRFVANGVFCVNALAPQHEDLAKIFAGRTGVHLDARFDFGVWQTMSTGAPALADAAVSFDCRIVEIQDVATHHVMIGEVLAARIGSDAPSLVYVHRQFRTV